MQNYHKGQSVVEVLIALAVMTLCVAAVGSLVLDAQRSTMGGLMRLQASLIASEGIEATRTIRDGDISALTVGIHGIALVSGRFEFVGASDTEEQFTRTIEVVDVDASTKRVTSSVSWNTLREGDSVDFVMFLSNR